MTAKEPKTKERKKFSEMESRFVTDYYKTNREITQSDRKRWKKEREERKKEGTKEPWSKSEIIMVVICVLAAVGIIIRYRLLGDTFPDIGAFFGFGAK